MSQSLDQALHSFAPPLPLAVALSGGADSTALLLACARKWPNQVLAVHINHGLQAAAVQFERQCQQLCDSLHVPLHILQVNANASAGQSPDDAARIARYSALTEFMTEHPQGKACQAIALGQHADDQVETLLLALSRGAGLPGLSAMPAQWIRKGLAFYRPLLEVSSLEIRRWLAQEGQSFIEDPTNTDEAFTRNRIRARLMPVLREMFPQYLDTFARSASHAAQAQVVLDEVAHDDWMRVCNSAENAPEIKKLQALSSARQSNVLRYWLKSYCKSSASAAQLQELLSQIAACTTAGHQIQIKVGSGFVRRSNAELAWYNQTV